MGINWNEVTVGETEIVAPNSFVYLVIGVRNRAVWLEDSAGFHFTVAKESCVNWTIDDPWEDVSHKCRFDDEFCVYHGNHMLIEDDIITGRYKRDEAGLRVWKRKEGM